MSDTIRKKRGRPKKMTPVQVKDIKRGKKQRIEVPASEVDALWRRTR